MALMCTEFRQQLRWGLHLGFADDLRVSVRDQRQPPANLFRSKRMFTLRWGSVGLLSGNIGIEIWQLKCAQFSRTTA